MIREDIRQNEFIKFSGFDAAGDGAQHVPIINIPRSRSAYVLVRLKSFNPGAVRLDQFGQPEIVTIRCTPIILDPAGTVQLANAFIDALEFMPHVSDDADLFTFRVDLTPYRHSPRAMDFKLQVTTTASDGVHPAACLYVQLTEA